MSKRTVPRRKKSAAERKAARRAIASTSSMEAECRAQGRTFAKWYSVLTYGGMRSVTRCGKHGRLPFFPYHILFCKGRRPLKKDPFPAIRRRIRKLERKIGMKP